MYQTPNNSPSKSLYFQWKYNIHSTCPRNRKKKKRIRKTIQKNIYKNKKYVLRQTSKN